MARFLSSLLVAFMLLAGPALCVGGLIEHECDCGDGGVEMQCQHEDSCSDDPCESIAVPLERDARSLIDIEEARVCLQAVNWYAEPDPAKWSQSTRPPLPPDRANLPFSQSDRPLLI